MFAHSLCISLLNLLMKNGKFLTRSVLDARGTQIPQIQFSVLLSKIMNVKNSNVSDFIKSW